MYNRTSWTDTLDSINIAYQNNAVNQYTQVGNVTPTYEAGNITTGYGGGLTLAYDAENRLVSAGGVSYDYDLLGRRIRRTDSSVTTTYVWDGSHIIAEYIGSSLTKKYIYGPGMDNPVVMISVSGANETWRYYYADALGSVRLMTDASGAVVESYTYDTYGQPRVMTGAGADNNWLTEDVATQDYSSIGNRFLFTGREWDSTTKLFYYRFRDYAPQLGRFCQTDPAGYIDTMNLYAYCGNNPVNWIDPWGLWGKREHYIMTYRALRQAGYSHHDAQIAAKASARTDNNPFAHSGWISSRHYLDGQEKSAEARINKLMRKARNAEKAGERKKAMRYLGRAAHTRQDQYSHAEQDVGSNWNHFFGGKDPDNISKHPEEFKNAYEATKDMVGDFQEDTGKKES